MLNSLISQLKATLTHYAQELQEGFTHGYQDGYDQGAQARQGVGSLWTSAKNFSAGQVGSTPATVLKLS